MYEKLDGLTYSHLFIRLKFIRSMVMTDGYVEEQKRSFRWAKELLNVTGFYLPHLVVIFQ